MPSSDKARAWSCDLVSSAPWTTSASDKPRARSCDPALGGAMVVDGAHSCPCSKGVAAGYGQLLRMRCGRKRIAAGCGGTTTTCNCEAMGPIASPLSSPIWR
ncbi:hypothetical protein BDA96_03G096800 [Sorghum bicolor]|uniref:Uncharacterized protein n=2 Tax=Sorghum bicolor TaxID=4558 RepID=A0A921RBB4_SORBI|nr:hypothetical protein BDA96_03G096800 [Sorghum bicolor]OQU86452.1 hypothetical protein SORBI_3003G092066 [Sorghum bicolor]